MEDKYETLSEYIERKGNLINNLPEHIYEIKESLNKPLRHKTLCEYLGIPSITREEELHRICVRVPFTEEEWAKAKKALYETAGLPRREDKRENEYPLLEKIEDKKREHKYPLLEN